MLFYVCSFSNSYHFDIVGRSVVLDRAGEGKKGGGKTARDGDPAKEPNKLFVGQLPYDVTEATIKEKFAEAGELTSVQSIQRFNGPCPNRRPYNKKN